MCRRLHRRPAAGRGNHKKLILIERSPCPDRASQGDSVAPVVPPCLLPGQSATYPRLYEKSSRTGSARLSQTPGDGINIWGATSCALRSSDPQNVVGAAGGNFRAGGHTIACVPKDLPLAAKLEPLCRRMHLPSLPMDTVGPVREKNRKNFFKKNPEFSPGALAIHPI